MAGAAQRKHDAYTVHVRKRYSDKRTTEGRKLKAVLNGLVKDLGGESKLTTGQRIILDALGPKLVMMWQIKKYVDENPEPISIIDKESKDLPPILKNTYSTLADSLRRDMEFLFLSKRETKHSDYERALRQMRGKES